MAKKRKLDRGNRIDEVPTTSFADIAFLLIIFFLLTLAITKTMGFRSELPAGEKSEEEPEKTTTVQLHEGQIRLDDKVLSMPRLREELADMDLRKLPDDDPKKVVLFEATGGCSWQEYFEIMAAVTKAGGNLVIVREADGEEGGDGE